MAPVYVKKAPAQAHSLSNAHRGPSKAAAPSTFQIPSSTRK
jgi:hypothetical protein